MKVLLVDDDPIKTAKIAAKLLQLGFLESEIHTAGTATDALARASTVRYDLAVVDVVLPCSPGSGPTADAGLDLVRVLSRQPIEQRPRWVAAVTAKTDQEGMDRRLSANGSVLLRYEEGSTEWSEGLESLVASIRANDVQGSIEYQSLACIVCALQTPEADAVLTLPWKWSDQMHNLLSGDSGHYKEGTFPSSLPMRNLHRVVCATAPRMGIAATTALALRMCIAYRPRLLIMVGITAGFRGEAEIGDVLCADLVFEWGTGKWTTMEGKSHFDAAIYPFSLDSTLRNIFANKALFNASLKRFYNKQKGRPDHIPVIHRGVIASGPSVVAASEINAFIKGHHRKLLGFDMETYGLFQAADEAPNPRPRAVSLKSVVDFGDERKGDSHQEYAAKAAAEVLSTFLRQFTLSPNSWL